MEPATSASDLDPFLSLLRAGAPTDLGDVVVVPILGGDESVDADLLEEALEKHDTEITEVDESGHVNEVRVRHRGARPLLLIDGEEILGAKQNRMVNASFLVAPGAEVTLPVSCVERGRWRHASPRFSSAGRTTSARLRSLKLRDVARSVTMTGRYDSDQARVWHEVDATLQRQHVTSRTSAYADLVTARTEDIEARVERLAIEPLQVGFAAVRRDELVVIDVVGSPRLFRRAWRKLARGLVADDGEPSSSPRATEIVARALKRAAATPCALRATAGTGDTLHAVSGGLAIGAVALAGRIYHAVIARA